MAGRIEGDVTPSLTHQKGDSVTQLAAGAAAPAPHVANGSSTEAGSETCMQGGQTCMQGGQTMPTGQGRWWQQFRSIVPVATGTQKEEA